MMMYYYDSLVFRNTFDHEPVYMSKFRLIEEAMQTNCTLYFQMTCAVAALIRSVDPVLIPLNWSAIASAI